MKIKFIFLLFCLFFISVAICYSQNTKKLIYDGRFDGPFKGTSIIRMYDPDYKVVCYMYIPETVSVIYSSSGIGFKDFVGNISCVKIK